MSTASAATTPTSSSQRATLSRELSEFLIELSIGVHRYSMYPAGHPSLRPAVENLVMRLSRLFATRDAIDIGVAKDQLLVEGTATEARHPVLSDLARRLHGHQLGALTLRAGVGARQLHEMLGLLAEESERGGDPVGLRDPESLPTWSHVDLQPLGYGDLALSGEVGAGGEARPSQLWLGLAQAALAGRGDGVDVGDVGAVARLIREHTRDQAYDQVIVGYMHQLADQLRRGRGKEAAEVRGKVSQLIRELDESTLSRLVSMGGDTAARRRFVLDANESLSVDAVVKILQSAASSSQQTVSNSMTRLLSKLSAHAERGAEALRTRAGAALRENVEQLLEGWELEDPNPDQYTRVLDAMSQATPFLSAAIADRPEEDRQEIPGPVRILRMALEIDAFGPTVEAAVLDMLAQGRGGELFEMLEAVDGTGELPNRVRQYLTDPDRVRRIIAKEGLDDDGLAHLVDEMGEAAIDPLLQVLIESDVRSVRRRLFDQLALLGGAIRPRIVAALGEAREWYVMRNLLALLAGLPEGAEGIDMQPYLAHPDARVRREAVPLALVGAEGTARARILASALADPDDRIVRTALVEIRDVVPETIVPTLVNRVVKGAHDDDLRVLAIRLLRASDSRLVREALLELVTEGKSLLGKTKLADRSAPVVAALETLAATSADDAEVRQVLEQARKSRDPIIRRSVSGT